MTPLAPRPPFRALAALLAVLIPIQGCHSWRVEPLQPEPSRYGDDMRLTLKDGRREVLSGAELLGDTIVGHASRQGPSPHPWGYSPQLLSHSPQPWERQAVAVQDVEQAEIREFDSGRTAALVVAFVAVTAGVVAALSALNHAISRGVACAIDYQPDVCS
jgi:hypothetical protein